ncbi:hypothetical protein [Microbacterium aurantiacum]|uniref:hypothetical protein n=1 Tax=Microbacterium aurantiacum TaxID=162393 RepID=UPI000C80B718|nr:hypothetical protein [Microbacterium aurantiacum]
MPQLLSDRARVVPPLRVYTREEARMAGFSVDSQRWMRLRKGVYVERGPYGELPPWERYAVRVHAFLRTHPDAVFCLESAGVFHGIPQFGETALIHVYAPDAGATQRYGDVIVHASCDVRDVERVGGASVTSLRDTVVDLARVMNPADALAVADAVTSPVQGGKLQVAELSDRGEQFENRRGRARMRWVWDHADGRSESPGESVSRAIILWCGYEVPELQREFSYDGHVDRCDFHFPSTGAIGEADGWGKYDLNDLDGAKQKLADEKRREDRLRRQGHPFARWDLRGAWQVDPLREALDTAGVLRVRPPQSGMLATLTRRPRAKTWLPKTTG